MRGEFLDVPVWALLVLAAAGGAWLLLVAGLTTATRPRPVRSGPATLDLGPEPPAIANLLTNGWRMTEDALSATLLDLAARDLLDLVQQGPEPEQTIIRVREAAPPDLLPYERRVYDRVAGLAAGGVVPVVALARGNSAQAGRWWGGFRREVIVDAQHRGLSRNRWGARIKSLVSMASVAPAAAVALVVGYAADDGEPVLGSALVSWAALTAYVSSRNRQRDTPAGREVAARWLGVRDHLGGNEVFDTLPPAAVAIWDRYLGYGAATGVAGTASRVLAFGAQDERLAWSAYGGSWHRVRVRYPGARAAEGRHPVVSALVGLVAAAIGWYGTRAVLAVRDEVRSWGVSEETVRALDSQWTQLGLLALAGGFAAVGGWGCWVVVRAVLDLGSRRTFEAEVLRVRVVRDDKGRITEHQVALDDGRSERTRAWAVPAGRWPGLAERDVVNVTVGPRLHHVYAMTVVRRGAAVVIDDATPGLTSQVIEEPAPRPGQDPAPGAGTAVGGVDPATLFGPAEVGAALGTPVHPARAVEGGSVFGVLGMRMAEFAAIDGAARVLVQVTTGGMAAAIGAGDGEPLPGGGMLRNGSVVLRGPAAVVGVHVRHAPPAVTDQALRRLAALAAERVARQPA